ncbi:MAG: sulfotransferase, partial [Flavobacteriales bacterium]
MNAPVFICGAHKSGTSLMRSLLDSHPELFVIPFETHYFQNVKHWVNNPYRKQFPESISTEEIIDSFTAWIEHYDTVDNPLADASITGKLNTKTF